MSRSKWRGLQALVQEAVDHGSRAVERVQLESARRPFAILEHLPIVAPAARIVHAAHDVSVLTTHAVIRAVNEVAGAAVAAAIDLAERDARRG
jgi:hypothetical protein